MSKEKINYELAKANRDKCTQEVLKCVVNPKKDKIVIVAGAGTGKTHLFREAIKKQPGKTLTLSFVNALVDDLSLGLSGLSEVKTLHGYAASYLRDRIGASIFAKLSKVIERDALVLIGKKDIDFIGCFQNLDGDKELISFYKKRKDYYGRYYGFADEIYATVKLLEQDKKNKKLPKYKQILVDEYQDFNEIEVALIKILSEESPIIVAGDDDQSLYMELKKANPKYIRDLDKIAAQNNASLRLPFCSRCPKVIVGAVSDLIDNAKKRGLLQDRINNKSFEYFPDKKKDEICEKYQHIRYFQRRSNSIANLIKEQLLEIANFEQNHFDVLVIFPPQIKKYCVPKLAKSLAKIGFKEVLYEKENEESGITLLDGLKLLLEDNDSNLGWRICVEELKLLDQRNFEKLIKITNAKDAPHIKELLTSEQRKIIRDIRSTLVKIKKGENIEKEKLNNFFEKIGKDPIVYMTDNIKSNLCKEETKKKAGKIRNICNIPIRITTIPKSKGLDADYIIIPYFDNQYFGGKELENSDIYSFLVAITRTRKLLFLISTTEDKPEILKWIKPERIKEDLMPENTRDRN